MPFCLTFNQDLGPLTRFRVDPLSAISLADMRPSVAVYNACKFGVGREGKDFTPWDFPSVALPHKLSRATLYCGYTSEGTSYQQFRLVFCHYPQIRGTNCILETLQASTLLSKRFTLSRDRSTAFVSQTCDFTPLSDVAPCRSCAQIAFATPPQ